MDGEPDPDPPQASETDSGEEQHLAAGVTPGEAVHGSAQPNRMAVWGAVTAAVAMALAFPAGETAVWLCGPAKASRVPLAKLPIDAAGWLDALPAIWIAVVIATWVFVFWSLIGSFLNVVVHRLPLGQSVVHGGSRCPRCNRAIRWHDNLPIVGWLRLGGRCRACSLPIAARYPIIESVCAGMGTAVYFRELLSGGANLPSRPPDFLHDGLLRLVPAPAPDLLGLTLYHSAALCVLLAWGLIALDRGRLPGWHAEQVLLVAAGLPMLVPALHPLPLFAGQAGLFAGDDWLVRGLAVSAAGGVVGLVCGECLHRLLGRLLRGDAAGRAGLPLSPPTSLRLGLVFTGVVFGWQAALGTTTLLLVFCLIQMLVWSAVLRWPALPTELLLVPATLLHLCGWRQLVEELAPWWPGASPTLACLAPSVALLPAVWLALAAITPERRPTPSRWDADRASTGTIGDNAS